MALSRLRLPARYVSNPAWSHRSVDEIKSIIPPGDSLCVYWLFESGFIPGIVAGDEGKILWLEGGLCFSGGDCCFLGREESDLSVYSLQAVSSQSPKI